MKIVVTPSISEKIKASFEPSEYKDDEKLIIHLGENTLTFKNRELPSIEIYCLEEDGREKLLYLTQGCAYEPSGAPRQKLASDLAAEINTIN